MVQTANGEEHKERENHQKMKKKMGRNLEVRHRTFSNCYNKRKNVWRRRRKKKTSKISTKRGRNNKKTEKDAEEIWTLE